jgi:hypothetical protein
LRCWAAIWPAALSLAVACFSNSTSRVRFSVEPLAACDDIGLEESELIEALGEQAVEHRHVTLEDVLVAFELERNPVYLAGQGLKLLAELDDLAFDPAEQALEERSIARLSASSLFTLRIIEFISSPIGPESRFAVSRRIVSAKDATSRWASPPNVAMCVESDSWISPLILSTRAGSGRMEMSPGASATGAIVVEVIAAGCMWYASLAARRRCGAVVSIRSQLGLGNKRGAASRTSGNPVMPASCCRAEAAFAAHRVDFC